MKSTIYSVAMVRLVICLIADTFALMFEPAGNVTKAQLATILMSLSIKQIYQY